MGSAILPKSVTRPQRRANSPSKLSVSEATAKTPQRDPAPGRAVAAVDEEGGEEHRHEHQPHHGERVGDVDQRHRAARARAHDGSGSRAAVRGRRGGRPRRLGHRAPATAGYGRRWAPRSGASTSRASTTRSTPSDPITRARTTAPRVSPASRSSSPVSRHSPSTSGPWWAARPIQTRSPGLGVVDLDRAVVESVASSGSAGSSVGGGVLQVGHLGDVVLGEAQLGEVEVVEVGEVRVVGRGGLLGELLALDEHLHLGADPPRGAVGADVVDQRGDPLDAGQDLGGVDLVGQVGGLGAVLVGVAEHPDGVELGLGEERLELGEVVLGLAGEADDDVGPDAGLGRQRADLRAQRQERLAGPEAPHPPQQRPGGVLEGQVEVVGDAGRAGDRGEQRRADLGRLQVGHPDPAQARHLGQVDRAGARGPRRRHRGRRCPCRRRWSSR